MKLALHTKVMLGFLTGTVAGVLAHTYALDSDWLAPLIDYVASPIGALFLRLLFMLVLPLMFSALVLGVTELGDIASIGRVGGRMLLYTAVVTSIAIGVGLLVVNITKPGLGLDPAALAAAIHAPTDQAKAVLESHPSLNGVEVILGIVPKNVVRAAADGDLLGVMFFALMLGIAMVLRPTPATAAFKQMLQGLNETVMTLIGLVIRLTPYAVAALMFKLCATLGLNMLESIFKYALTVIVAIAIHMFIVLPLWVLTMGGMRPLRFFRESQEAILTAFSTASSTGTLPTTIKVAEQNLHLPPKVARFVLTIGASANHHGTALFEGLTTLFLAQCYGVDLSLAQQAMVMGLCIVGSIGTAGVPAGSLPVIAMILGYLHVPPEAIGLILGVDRFLDMCRTALNVTGDLATAVVVSRGEVGHPALLHTQPDQPVLDSVQH